MIHLTRSHHVDGQMGAFDNDFAYGNDEAANKLTENCGVTASDWTYIPSRVQEADFACTQKHLKDPGENFHSVMKYCRDFYVEENFEYSKKNGNASGIRPGPYHDMIDIPERYLKMLERNQEVKNSAIDRRGFKNHTGSKLELKNGDRWSGIRRNMDYCSEMKERNWKSTCRTKGKSDQDAHLLDFSFKKNLLDSRFAIRFDQHKQPDVTRSLSLQVAGHNMDRDILEYRRCYSYSPGQVGTFLSVNALKFWIYIKLHHKCSSLVRAFIISHFENQSLN